MFSLNLQIKRLTLTAEARIIHRKEKKLRRQQRQRPTQDRDYSRLTSLHEHRINVVRPAARAAHLAHAILRGHAYARVEHPNTRTVPPIDAVAENLRSFGPLEVRALDKKTAARMVVAWTEGGAGLEAGILKPRLAGSTPAAAS